MHNQKNAQNLHIEFKMADLLSEGYGFRAFFFFFKEDYFGGFFGLKWQDSQKCERGRDFFVPIFVHVGETYCWGYSIEVL